MNLAQENQYAGFWLRLVAMIIDLLIVGIFIEFVAKPLLALLGFGYGPSYVGLTTHEVVTMVGEQPDIAIGEFLALMGYGSNLIVPVLCYNVIWLLYFALMECSSKQATIGKLVIKLKVTNLEGERISFIRATGRYFGKIISQLPLYFGFFMAGFTKRKQALHDIMADCLVVRG